jgi:hypothetical protein
MNVFVVRLFYHHVLRPVAEIRDFAIAILPRVSKMGRSFLC